jgi:uncharacterized protein YprB with RNaseH-like and TPR domain
MAPVPDRFARLAALRPTQRAVTRADKVSLEDSSPAGLGECTLAKLLGATIARTKFGNHLSIRNWYATPEFPEVASAALDLLCRTQDAARTKKWREAADDPEKWLFLDTETTGLAGGTGTYAFLIGIAWWDSGGMQVEQFLMRDFSEEHSVLQELAARLAERPVLVTFNGKTFDWPLLESRYLMTRCIQVPELAAHLDLLHPARAVWKLRLGSVRLVELERHVLNAPRLGWHREDDVPSSLIPQFYFDYLRGASPAPLVGVVRHNGMDLRGLGALFAKLNSLLDSQHGEAADALDLFGLSRYLQRRGQPTKAESACMAARERGLPLPFDTHAQRELAQMAKRRGEHTAAVAIWEQLLEDIECRTAACEELAIYHERRTRDFAKALEYAQHGLREAREGNNGLKCSGISTTELRRVERLAKRVARLENRLAGADWGAASLLRHDRATAAAD